MSKKIEKTAGRPPANIDEYFTKILPYLSLGLSLHKSCIQANVPYTTVIDYCKADENFRNKIDRNISNPVIISRTKLIKEAEEKDWGETDAHKFILENLDQDFRKKETQVNINEQKILVVPSEILDKYKIAHEMLNDSPTRNTEDSSN